jgi:hypothetical protein
VCRRQEGAAREEEETEDGVDCMGLSRLLVEGVQMVPVQETGHFRLSRASREDVDGALAV